MTWYQIAGSCIASFAFGYMIGMFRRDENDDITIRDHDAMIQMNRMQQARGDHWFHEYQMMIREREESE